MDTIRGIVAKLNELKDTLGGHLKQTAEMEITREPDLRKGELTVGEYLYPSGDTDKHGSLKSTPYHAYIPSLISQCSSSSELAKEPCEHCARGRGSFASCRIDPHHGGCCLNCWHSKSVWDCSLYNTQGKESAYY